MIYKICMIERTLLALFTYTHAMHVLQAVFQQEND